MHELIYRYSAYLIFPGIACMVSLALTRFCIFVLPKLNFMASPGGRHIHKTAVPRGGGIAIISGFLVTWIIFLSSGWNYFQGSFTFDFIKRILPSLLLLCITGLIDDRFNIKARYKLFIQLLSGFLVWYYGIRLQTIYGFQLPQWVSCSLTMIWITGFINAFNLIDGLDGLAVGLGIIASVSLAVTSIFLHTPLNTVVLLCFAGACLGFLFYNFHPAKIFMGDTGSMFLGFMIGVIGINTSTKLASFSAVLVPLLAAGVPIFDTFLAIWRRFAKRFVFSESGKWEEQKIMEPDTDHLHHRILKKSESQRKTTIILYILALILAVVSIVLVLLRDRVQGLGFIIVLGTFVAAIRYLAHIEMWNSARALVSSMKIPKRTLLSALFHPFFDVICISVCFIFSYYLFHPFVYNTKEITKLLYTLFYNILPPVVAMHIFFMYRRVWARASAADYIRLGQVLILGFSVNTIIQFFLYHPERLQPFLAQNLIFFLLSSGFIITERMSLRCIRTLMMKNLYFKTVHSHSVPRVLIYGAGYTCRFYITLKYSNIEKDPVYIIGIIDDTPALRHQYVYGHEVLGSIEDLKDIYETYNFQRIVITFRNLSSHKEKYLREFCNSRNIVLTKFFFFEEVHISQ